MDHGYTEEPWVEMVSDSEDEGNGFNGMFDDPDPYDTFVHSFSKTDGDLYSITLVGHKAEIGQTLNSTGLTLWRAAPLLCQFITDHSERYITGKHVLELGGGLGLCGILAGALGARRVYITDGDSASLTGMRENVIRNNCYNSDGCIACKQLRWGSKLEEFKRMTIVEGGIVDGRFETIMGSDIIYVESILEPLFQTVDACLRSDGTFILAYARRNVKIDLVFSTAHLFGFEWSQSDGEEGCFVFTRMRKRVEEELR